MEEELTLKEFIELQKKELGAAALSVKELHDRFTAYDEKLATKEELDTVREQLENALTAMNRTGKDLSSPDELAQLQAKEFGHYVTHGIDYDQTKFAELGPFEKKAMESDNLRKGGYWMATQTYNRILEEVVNVDPLRQLVSSMTLSEGDTLEGFYEHGTLDAAWTTERATITEKATPEVDKWEIPTHPMYVYPKLTQKMARLASFPVESWLTGKYATAFGYLENLAFLKGTGVGQPKGIMTHVTDGNIAHTPSGDANSILSFDPLITLQDSLDERYQGNACWVMNRSTRTLLRKIKAVADGRYMLEEDVTLGAPVSLFGKPVYFMYNMDNIAAGKDVMLYGDLKQLYMVVDAPGAFVIRDEVTDFGRIILKTERLGVGGDVVDFDAVKALRIEAS